MEIFSSKDIDSAMVESIKGESSFHEVSDKMNPEDYVSKFLDMSNDAKQNNEDEKQMTITEGIRTFPKAAMWSIILSSTLVMEGYDTNLLNSFYGQDAFAKKFGTYYEELEDYQIPARWQTAMSMCVYVGEILGLLMAGNINERFGYRKTLICALTLVSGFIFIVFFAQSLGMLTAGQLLLGIPWGIFQTLPVAYASDVCPMVLRVYLTTYINVCWVFGQLLAAGVLRAFVSSKSEWAYKVPFAIQWVWPIPIAIGVYFAPESPWWLLKKNRTEEAEQAIGRLLTSPGGAGLKDNIVKLTMNKMRLTIKEEELMDSKSTSYIDCFKGKSLRRTRITALVWLSQNITGTSLRKYSTYFFIQAGLSSDMSFTFSIIQYALGIVGTLLSWFVEKWAGHFSIYFYGLCTMFTILIIVGGLGTGSSTGGTWAIGSLILLFTFVYDLTIGPMVYCIIAEVPSVRLKNKTIILARATYSMAGIVIAIITPYMLNPSAWNWGAKTGFFWGGFALLCIIWSYFELPETKGRTYAELDVLFEGKTKAREFKNNVPELFEIQSLIQKMGESEVKNFVGDQVENV